MARYISEEKLIVSLMDYSKGKKTIGQCVTDTPTEEVTPIIRKKCYIAHGMYENRIWCNNCGFIKVITGEEKNYNFCPKCGAIVEESGGIQ